MIYIIFIRVDTNFHIKKINLPVLKENVIMEYNLLCTGV